MGVAGEKERKGNFWILRFGREREKRNPSENGNVAQAVLYCLE